MDSIIDLLSIHDLTLEQSRQYMAGSYDQDMVLDISVPNDNAFHRALQEIRRREVDMKTQEVSRIATACLYSINTAQDVSGTTNSNSCKFM